MSALPLSTVRKSLERTPFAALRRLVRLVRRGVVSIEWSDSRTSVVRLHSPRALSSSTSRLICTSAAPIAWSYSPVPVPFLCPVASTCWRFTNVKSGRRLALPTPRRMVSSTAFMGVASSLA